MSDTSRDAAKRIREAGRVLRLNAQGNRGSAQGITGFRLRETKTNGRNAYSSTLPAPHLDKGAQDRVMAKINAIGEGFYSLSEDEYGDWLDALPQGEFIEFIAVMIALDDRSSRVAA
ncbi:hypothetical protein [Burkholderia ubonensis]|uniref:hypothetical protein n=1 Tax=Burkholderia ubonensis TaxID=101571 RepID=UPI000754CD20|nr:hypothetical protein [Burkholderia ubonensis]KWK63664.1 hypothetical protein WM15_12330 [Burkholderia ubonensis]